MWLNRLFSAGALLRWFAPPVPAMETHSHLEFVELILRQEPDELRVESWHDAFVQDGHRYDFRFEDASANGVVHITVLAPSTPARLPEVYRVLLRGARHGVIDNPFVILSRDYALLSECFDRAQLRPHFARLNQVRGVV